MNLSLHWPLGAVNHPAATAAPRAPSRPVGAFPSFPSASLRLPGVAEPLAGRGGAAGGSMTAEARGAPGSGWRRRRGVWKRTAGERGGGNSLPGRRGAGQSGRWQRARRGEPDWGGRGASEAGGSGPSRAGGGSGPEEESGRPPARSPESLASARPAGRSCRRVCLFVFPFPPPFHSPPAPPLPLEPARRGEEIAREAGTREPGAARIQEAREHGARPLGRPPRCRAVRGGGELFQFLFFFPLFFIFFSFLPSPFFLPARFSLRFNICFWRATSPRAASPPSHVGGHLCRGESGWLHTEIGAQGSEAEALAGLLAVPQPEQPGGALAAAPAQRYRRPPAAPLPYRCPRAVSPCLPPGPPPRSRARFGGPCSCSAKRASCGTAVARCPEGCPRYLAPLLRVT